MPAHSPGVGDEHTSTSRRPPAPHRTSSARSSTNRLRSSIPPAIEEIPDFFRPPKAPTEDENPLIHLIAEHGLLHLSSGAAGKMSLLFKSGYLKERWKWEYVPQSQRDIYWLRCSSLGNCKCHLRYMKRGVGRQPSNEEFKKKSEQMSANRKSDVGGPGTGISLLCAGTISARRYGDTLEKKLKRCPTCKEMFRHLHTHSHDGQTFVRQRSAKIDAELTRRFEEMSVQSPDTSIDEDAVHLEVVPKVKGRVYGLGSQGYHRIISSGEESSSRGPAYGPYELEELQRDHQRLQKTLPNERMERQEQMQRDKMERQEENREIQDHLARMEALLMQHLSIRPHVPPTPRPPLLPSTERSGPQSDDQPGHLTTDRAPLSPPPPSQLRTKMTTSLDIGPIHIESCLRIDIIFWMIMMSLCRNLCHLCDYRHGNSDWMFYLFYAVAFGIGVAYKGVGKASLFLLVIEGRDGLSGGKAYQRMVQISYIISTILISRIWMRYTLPAKEFVQCLSMYR
ncbi:hypothetical protein Scep_021391 [Stephania cephalantha]|uniref:Uncharacterized protein n=1 Tax=Stephania cephalantha TaxID=152367 RepID=A0AAP0I068_9MAGN